jgi:hypothetical protein
MVYFSYINLIEFFPFFVSTGLTVCYSFRLCYDFCGDFNLSSFYSISESNLNILYINIYILYSSVVYSYYTKKMEHIKPRNVSDTLERRISTISFSLMLRLNSVPSALQIEKF